MGGGGVDQAATTGIVRAAMLSLLLACQIGTASGQERPAKSPADTGVPAQAISDATARWRALNAQVVAALGRAAYAEAEPLAREALDLARQAFGDHDGRIIASLDNLGQLVSGQKRYAEAEPFFREALRAKREMLGPRHPDTLTEMSMLASWLEDRERYVEAEQLLREVEQGRRETLGLHHPNTIRSMNNLASLLRDRGRAAEAEPFARAAWQARLETLGPRHPDTLSSLSNLAGLLALQDRYAEAEPLTREALQARRETLGPRHPDTLASLNNLAVLLHGQGRYAEAEAAYQQALQARRELLGPDHPQTITSMTNLADLLRDQHQGRDAEAESLYREALRSGREALTSRHPQTLATMNGFASLLRSQRRYNEAERLVREALQVRRETLGPRHPDTLASLDVLAALLSVQGRFSEAEPLYQEALQGSRATQGPRHRTTLNILGNLALLLADQGRYGEAEPLAQEALRGQREVLGSAHPYTLHTQLGLVILLAAQGRVREAARQHEKMAPQLLTWLGAEYHGTEAAPLRGQLVSSQATYQDVAFSLALLPGAPREAAGLAASTALRFKDLAAEEEAFLGAAARRGETPAVRALAVEVAGLRARLVNLSTTSAGPELNALAQTLDAREQALGAASPAYSQGLRVRNASLSDLRGVLAGMPVRAALLELRQYHPVDFRTGDTGEARWAGVLVSAGGAVQVRDLGPVSASTLAVRRLLDRRVADTPLPAEAAEALHGQLVAPFAAELAGVERLYIAPDGMLYLANMALLRAPDGRRLTETMDVRLVQTGRDLLRPALERPARGLIALGDVAFDLGVPPVSDRAAPPSQAAPAGLAVASAAAPGVPTAVPTGAERDDLRRGTLLALDGDRFGALPGSKAEAEAIVAQYLQARGDEPAPDPLEGAQASKARLLALPPPRVLHLATHAFYRGSDTPQDRPMLLAGIALAGANQAGAEGGQDGILYAIEAQDLNLEGTELVVLAACETAQGQVDYGNGVSGLVRAIRTAGARSVLVSLRRVDDGASAEFMQRFYAHWLAQEHGSDPAAALRQTQLDYLAGTAPGAALTQASETWTSFILVGG